MSKEKKEKPELNFDGLLAKLMAEVDAIVEPSDELNLKLDELETELQRNINKIQEMTIQDPAADVEPIFDEVQRLKKKIEIIKMQLKAYPDEVDRGLKSVLERARGNPNGGALIQLAESTLDTGIKEQGERQARIDELVKKKVPDIEKTLIGYAEEIGNLERRKAGMAGQLLDLDSCFPREERKRPHPGPFASWSNCIVDEDRIGRAFGSELPAFHWQPGENL